MLTRSVERQGGGEERAKVDGKRGGRERDRVRDRDKIGTGTEGKGEGEGAGKIERDIRRRRGRGRATEGVLDPGPFAQAGLFSFGLCCSAFCCDIIDDCLTAPP